MKLTLLVVALALQGCSFTQTPKELMASGTQSTHQLRSAPSEAVWCMSRNVENWRPNALGAALQPQVRPLPPGMELVVNMVSLDLSTIIVAHLMPAELGSEALVWLTTRPIIHGREETLKAMLDGC